MIKKIVIPAAGLGTRLLSITKEIPKEMLPLYTQSINGGICLKPIVQIVFEQLFNTGFREFCFIVGREKRAIQDHFSPDQSYLTQLKTLGKQQETKDLEEFYDKIESSTIVWINQPKPKGFGHAVLQARSFTNNEPFIVHAGDTIILSKDKKQLQQITTTKKAATLSLLEVKETKHYGIAEITGSNPPYYVKKVIEKPEKPTSNLAIMPIYAFTKKIYEALDETKPDERGEIQLTDGIQKIIEWQDKVIAFKLSGVLHLDIGTPESYCDAQNISFEHLTKGQI